jgi:hypothetical protein
MKHRISVSRSIIGLYWDLLDVAVPFSTPRLRRS